MAVLYLGMRGKIEHLATNLQTDLQSQAAENWVPVEVVGPDNVVNLLEAFEGLHGCFLDESSRLGVG